MPRYSVNISDEEKEELVAWADREDRSVASMMRCIFRAALKVGDVGKLTSKQRQNDVTSASLQRQNGTDAGSDQQGSTHAPPPGESSPDQDPDPEKIRIRSKKGTQPVKPPAKLAPPEIRDRIMGHLNATCDKNYRLDGQTASKLIALRMADGYSEADFIHVIDVKSVEWKGTSQSTYLRPSTLFGKEKMETYIGQTMADSERSRQRGSGGKKNSQQRINEAQKDADYEDWRIDE